MLVPPNIHATDRASCQCENTFYMNVFADFSEALLSFRKTRPTTQNDPIRIRRNWIPVPEFYMSAEIFVAAAHFLMVVTIVPVIPAIAYSKKGSRSEGD